MGYGLGIDVGTTFTAAALNRDGHVEMFPLATYQVAVPSVIFAEGAVMLFGDPADRRGAVQPLGLAREFKRRLGDPVPLMLSGSPYHADRLTALMAKWVVETVTDAGRQRPGPDRADASGELDRVPARHPAQRPRRRRARRRPC